MGGNYPGLQITPAKPRGDTKNVKLLKILNSNKPAFTKTYSKKDFMKEFMRDFKKSLKKEFKKLKPRLSCVNSIADLAT